MIVATKKTSSPSANSSRKKNQRLGVEEQRKIILEAAVELFSAEGSNAVSVSKICKKASVSRDTYYRCFADKDELVGFLYQTSVNEHMLAALSTDDVDFCSREWLHQAVDSTVDAILADHKYAQFLYVESATPNSHAHTVVHLAYDKVAGKMQRWCKKSFRHAPKKELFKSLLIAIQWSVHNAIIKGMSEKEIRIAKQTVEQLLYGVFSSLEQ